MNQNPIEPPTELIPENDPWWKPLLSFGYLFILIFIGINISNALVTLGAYFIMGREDAKVLEYFSDPSRYPEYRNFLLGSHGFISIISFLIPSLYYLYKIKTPLNPSGFHRDTRQSFRLIMITLLISVASLAPISLFIEWNKNMVFPEFLHSFESWARNKENQLEQLTLFIVDFDTSFQFFSGLVVLAIIPALGEEILFRGIIQQRLYAQGSNIHVAIWVSAFLFGAVHMQFFGLLPRMLLGGLFGYLFYWSKDITIPVLAHFLNNAIALSLNYFNKTGTLDFDEELFMGADPLILLLYAALLIIFIYFFRKIALGLEKGLKSGKVGKV